MEEIKLTLKDGSIVLINELTPSEDGLKRFLVESENASFDAFTYTPKGIGKDDFSPTQQKVAVQIEDKLPN